jgi:hypothetical protein
MTETRNQPTSPPIESQPDPQPHPPTDGPRADVRRSRSVGTPAHLTSIIVALALVPVAYGLFDYAMTHALPRAYVTFDHLTLPPRAVLPVLGGFVLLLLASAVGRLSGLGPLLAGLVWGVAPTVIVLVRPLALLRQSRHLPDLYPLIGTNLATTGIVVFPVAGALLIGAGFAGRWRRRA